MLCAQRQNKWPMKIRNVYGISEMATSHHVMNDDLLEERLVQMWPDYPCFYDVRDASCKSATADKEGTVIIFNEIVLYKYCISSINHSSMQLQLLQ